MAPEAFALAVALNDDTRASRASLLALSGIHRYSIGAMAADPEYVEWAERADRYAQPGTLERGWADMWFSTSMRVQGRLSEASSLSLRAVEMARQLGDRDLLYQSLGVLVSRPYTPQNQGKWVEWVREFADELSGGGRSVLAADAFHALGLAHLYLGDRARAEGLWRQLVELGERTRHPQARIRSIQAEAFSAFVDGRLEDALAAMGRHVALLEETRMAGVGRDLLQFLPLLYLGRAEEALSAPRMPSRDSGWSSLLRARRHDSRRALCLAHLGRMGEAREALHVALDQHQIGPDKDETPASELVNLLEAAVLMEDPETAALLVGRLNGLDPQIAVEGTWPARHLGAAAAMLGNPDEARDYYQQALEAAGKIRFRPEIALARLQLAELLLEHYPDECAEAQDHLDFAIAELRDMKMQPALDRALGLLAGLDTKPTAKPAYPDGLTQREVEVLRLIADGRSNQQIAEALFITTNTVANHVKNILTKSNTANRAEAAAYGVRHGLAEE